MTCYTSVAFTSWFGLVAAVPAQPAAFTSRSPPGRQGSFCICLHCLWANFIGLDPYGPDYSACCGFFVLAAVKGRSDVQMMEISPQGGQPDTIYGKVKEQDLLPQW